MEENYRIGVDKYVKEPVQVPPLPRFYYETDGGKITCEDSNGVKITAKDKEQHDKLKVAFQLACRHVDRWEHHFRLLSPEEELEETIKQYEALNDQELKDSFNKLVGLHYTVLLYLHRASDFINRYSEVAVVTALFGLELQVNKIYEKLEEDGKIKGKVPLRCIEGLHNKICNLNKNGFIKEKNDLQWLLALVGLRNKLAHVDLGKLKRSDVCDCEDKRIDSLMTLLELKEEDFYNSSVDKSRLKHGPSKKLINRVIEAIVVLHNIKT